MDKRNRAWRRAQKQLNKSRRVQRCSCWMCGNPRKYFKGVDKITIQERKQFESERDYIDPWEDDSYAEYIDWVKHHLDGTCRYYDEWDYSWDWWYDYLLEKEK